MFQIILYLQSFKSSVGCLGFQPVIRLILPYPNRSLNSKQLKVSVSVTPPSAPRPHLSLHPRTLPADLLRHGRYSFTASFVKATFYRFVKIFLVTIRGCGAISEVNEKSDTKKATVADCEKTLCDAIGGLGESAGGPMLLEGRPHSFFCWERTEECPRRIRPHHLVRRHRPIRRATKRRRAPCLSGRRRRSRRPSPQARPHRSAASPKAFP